MDGVHFLTDGHGWMALGRSPLLVTTDGGVKWSPVAVDVADGDVNSMGTPAFVDDRHGMSLVTRPDGQFTGAYTSADGGHTWTLRHKWPFGSASSG